MSEIEKGSSAVRVSDAIGGPRCFQVRSIGTQELTFRQIASDEQVQAIIKNSHAIFRLSDNKATRRPNGMWDLNVTFTPDNGMMHVYEHKPIVNTAGDVIEGTIEND